MFENILMELIEKTAVYLPDDVMEKLKVARDEEKNERAKKIYDIMFENIKLAQKKNVPLCQDTGVLEFFIKVGSEFPNPGAIRKAIIEATAEATERVPLRPNAIEDDGKRERNTGNNIGSKIPWIEWEIVEGREAEITLYLAGGGSSLPGASKVIPPHSESTEGMVVSRIAQYGVNACPPLFVGIGIGATSEIAAMLSKKAIVAPLGEESEEESAIREKINALNIGPQGFGGKTSALAVRIERSARHPAAFAIGISTGCWAHRRGIVRIEKDLSYEIVSHRRLDKE
jgi:L(+)-tartrate dehydratase alpha subunit